MIGRLEGDDQPPRTSIRERLAILEAAERADRERARRRHHWPHASIVWLVVVLFAALLASCLVRPW
jgi:hypothetical protein